MGLQNSLVQTNKKAIMFFYLEILAHTYVRVDVRAPINNAN